MRVDWFAIIADLNRNGVPGRSLDELCGISRHKVQHMKSGAEPKYDDGQKLLALNCASNGKSLWEPNEFVAIDCRREGSSLRDITFRVEAMALVNTFINRMVRGSV